MNGERTNKNTVDAIGLSYYCESVGHISEKSIKKYIDDQKNK